MDPVLFRTTLPDLVVRILDLIPGAYIMGGAIISSILGEPRNDIDLFFPHHQTDYVLEILDQNPEVRSVDYTMCRSRHIGKVTLEGVEVDLISYGFKFYPFINVDFYARMIRFDGKRFIMDRSEVLDDIEHKILRKNSLYYCKSEKALERTIEKYSKRGWTLTE